MPKIYVLDSTVFLQGYASEFVGRPAVTTYRVLEEVREPKARIQLDLLMQSGLEVIKPSEKSLKAVEKMLKKTADKLSPTDRGVLALALDFKKKGKEIAIVSDDYGVQNTGKLLKLEVKSVVQRGIKRTLAWTRKCPACKKETDEDECPACGTPTKRYSRQL